MTLLERILATPCECRRGHGEMCVRQDEAEDLPALPNSTPRPDEAPMTERCSCDESAHLREALRKIKSVCHGRTPGTPVDDMAVIANLAEQGLELVPLVGDPGVYPLSKVRRP